jgi:ketosteroid isomerase-like protein
LADAAARRRGDVVAEAQQARSRAVSARRRAIAAAMRRRRPEITRAGELAMTYEGFSGPMFQHPGTAMFTEEELRRQVDALYPHLSERQRESLARRLAAADRRSRAVQQRQGTYEQTGQRLDRRELFVFTHTQPADLAEARRAYASTIRRNRLTPTGFDIDRVPAGPDGFRTHAVLTGEIRRRGRDPQEMTFTFDSAPESPIPTDASMLAQARDRVANPEKFAWRIATEHRNTGTTRRAVIAEGVISYLHHGSLDVSAHEHFTRPETDRTFFAHSTFQPAPARPRRPAPARAH